MPYYEIAVGRKVIAKQTVLTYHCSEAVPLGSVVRLSIGRMHANGIVFKEVLKPKFTTKEIGEVLYAGVYSSQQLQLFEWIAEYYNSAMPELVQHVLPAGLEKNRRAGKKDETTIKRHASDQPLTADQQTAYDAIAAAKAGSTSLLHGVTGSGKTRVYIELLKQVQAARQSGIVLVPEIGLTSQLAADIDQHFDNVFIVHSNQTEATRHKQWEAIREAKHPIIVGPRSALFAPLQNLGIVIIDEAHDSSYKSDKSPKYHGLRVASKYAQITGAKTVLGTATPSVTDYFLAEQTNSTIARMPEPVSDTKRATVYLIDNKDRNAFGRSSKLFSEALIKAMRDGFANGRQSLLFHNRRGSATMVVCTDCGWVAECPDCGLPLTYHHDTFSLRCHTCNYRHNSYVSCPSCAQPSLLYKGFGTKHIAEEAQRLIPEARIARFDGDTKPNESVAARYEELYKGEVDIIVGTQMIVKGLDLPQLDTVGVVLADSSLYLPDYSANERTYQLLAQVIGRAGRHSGDGAVFIQTYTPQHQALRAAAARDYDAFYKAEIAQRKELRYPPYTYLLTAYTERASSNSAATAASKVVQDLLEQFPGLQVLGPSPAFREKSPSGYRWQIVVKAAKRTTLQKVANALPDKWHIDIDPLQLL